MFTESLSVGKAITKFVDKPNESSLIKVEISVTFGVEEIINQKCSSPNILYSLAYGKNKL